jgi:hypothetical protein
MTSALGLLRAVTAWLERILPFEGHDFGRQTDEGRAAEQRAEQAAGKPPETEYRECEIDERERELRMLMAHWM